MLVESKRDRVLPASRLPPPMRDGHVEEHVRREEALGRVAGLQERNQVSGDPANVRVERDRGAGRHRAPTPAARLRATTAIVSANASAGLNSTSSVPRVTAGT